VFSQESSLKEPN